MSLDVLLSRLTRTGVGGSGKRRLVHGAPKLGCDEGVRLVVVLLCLFPTCRYPVTRQELLCQILAGSYVLQIIASAQQNFMASCRITWHTITAREQQ